MPFFQRKHSAVIASAADAKSPERAKRIKAAQQAWQGSAWRMFDKLAEIHYPGSYVGSTMGRFMWPIGVIPEDDVTAQPVAVTAKDRTDLDRAAEDIMFAFEGPLGGASALARLYGINMTVAADGWLVGEDERIDGVPTTSWEFLSVEELRPTDEGKYHRFSYSGSILDDGYEPSTIRRFWQAHPARTQMADSSMNSLLDDCERLIILNNSMRARIVSRLAQAGIVFVPSELQIHGAPQAPAGDGQKVSDPFMAKFMTDIEKAVTDPTGNGGGVTPIGVRGPATAGEAIRFITMDRTIDRVEMELRAELRANIAGGLFLPPEAQTGMGDSTHWQAWGINDSTYQHILPLAEDWGDGVTRQYLWPLLRSWNRDPKGGKSRFSESDIRRRVVMPDGSKVITHPNMAEDLRQLNDRIIVKDSALLRHAGIDEGEIPSEEEALRMFGRKTNDPYLFTFGQKIADEIDWDKVAKPSGGAPGVGGTPPSRRPADSSDPAGAPGEGETQVEEDEMAAALVLVFTAAAGGYLAAAQKKVGAKLRALCEPHPEIHAAVKPYPNEKVLSAIDDLDDIGTSEADVVAMLAAEMGEMAPVILATATVDPELIDLYAERVAALAVRQLHTPVTPLQLRALAQSVLSARTT